MNSLEDAEVAMRAFKRSVDEGHPWVPGGAFESNPGLEEHILRAFEDFVRVQRVAEQSKPAKRVSLTEE